MSKFTPQSRLTDVGKNILRKRYYSQGEHKWRHVADRVVGTICKDWKDEDRDVMYDIIYNRYLLPNSPTLVNAGKERNAGLSACFVVPFKDTIEDIYRTKLEFALIARKGGGCGTTLTDIRPKNATVNGSTHGFAGGPIAFADTISHDMKAITQSGFRSMAIMFAMSVYHPDSIEFINCKSEEGKISNANISVVVDDEFMQAVADDETFTTEFNGKKFETYRAKDVFEQIVEGAWRNGEPGLLFDTAINDSPYKYAGVRIDATNPCGEQPLPPYGSCNLGALDLKKFFRRGVFDWKLFEEAIRYSVRFLDSVIDVNEFPTEDVEKVSKASRQIGLGLMGLADYYLRRELAYGSKQALEEQEAIVEFMWKIAKDESEIMGKELGVPEWCKNLPEPRRNITLLTIAPTGTTSLIAGCNSGIEPFFSEITQRKDKTGEYILNVEESDKPYFRCAVPMDGDKKKEVTWTEHVLTQAVTQKWIDSGVSKTINFPQKTQRDTIGKAFMLAWEEGCKGITIYRNGSRNEEVLKPKNLNKNLCPMCSAPTMKYDGCTNCTECDWSLCEI